MSRGENAQAPVAQPGRCLPSLEHCLGNPFKQARVTSSNLVRGSRLLKAGSTSGPVELGVESFGIASRGNMQSKILRYGDD